VTKEETLSDRLVFALDQSNMRKIDLARAVGVSPQVVHRLCNSKTHSTRFAYTLANALGVNLKWLTSGEGPAYPDEKKVQPSTHTYTAVPILEKAQINHFVEQEGRKLERYAGKSFYIKNKAKNIFAFIMPDTSMEPIIKKNSTMAFQKQDNKIENNDIVLIYLKKFDEHLVRTYTFDKENNKVIFSPYNTEIYKPIDSENIKIIGRLIAYSWEEQQ
jgi:transcriptional regulator with XRE-family HTH domain